MVEPAVESQGGVVLKVGQTSFPFIKAVADKGIRAMYTYQGIAIPRPSLAICTFAKTTDGALVLTERGPGTNMYPGRFYGQGGNPELTSTDIEEHQYDEMLAEIRVGRDDVSDISRFQFGGIVNDHDELENKPDLIGWVTLKLTAGEVRDRVLAVPYEQRETDAIDVAFAPIGGEGLLADYLGRADPNMFCPPAHAGLFIYGVHNFGPEWGTQVATEIDAEWG